MAPATARLREWARVVAHQGSLVLLQGETGSGKEILARYIHQNSPRADRPFIPVDCSSFSETLFESQFFGHVKGAFTGAMRDTLGFVRAADGGTLFLDEIGELPLALQAKFLRVIQEKCVVSLGDFTPRPVDIRIVCATNRDLLEMVENKTFREDLYYRINVVNLRVPPLRERQEDVIPLAEHFLAKHAALDGRPPKSLSAHAAESLARYCWPGNIRELFNALERACILSEGPVIQLGDLPPPLANFGFLGTRILDDLNLKSVERRTIIEALKRSGYNRAAACRLLGLERRRLNRMISILKIPMAGFPPST
ncbi:MAG: sigma-54 dependent transcriptional regulator [Tepidisphaeraceae bacterium]